MKKGTNANTAVTPVGTGGNANPSIKPDIDARINLYVRSFIVYR